MDSLSLAQFLFLGPLAAYVLLALFNKLMPRRGDWFGMATMFACFLASLVLFFRARGEHPLFVHWTFDWLPAAAGANLSGGILVDGLTAVMLVVVTLVSFLVHLFSSAYMHGDVRYGRYFTCLMLFTTSMLGLVLADNILFLFIFWELVGLSSYTLIGHWYEKKSASNAAIKAFITTRIGDVGMLLGMLIIYAKVGSLQYVDVFAAVGGVLTDAPGAPWLTLAGLGLFFGAMGKSAQFPLHVWLPDAMEGPTPVSALIHAATMVAAGVYLVGRLFPLFTPDAFLFIAYVGAITAIFAASIALVQDDIKKVLAYSTLSQLGYMMMALGVGGFVVGGYYAGLFHLTTHAFFKAGLFLGSGSVIHAMHHEQRLSRYGGLRKKLPITHATYLMCVLAIIGCPFFSGFKSKDAVLGATLQFGLENPKHLLLPLIGFATAAMTAFYMFRQFFLTFYGEPRDHHAYDHAHESPARMTIPLMTLAFLALVGGGFAYPLAHGSWFENLAPPSDRASILRSYDAYHKEHASEVGIPATVAAIAALPAASHGDDHGHGDAHASAGAHGDGHDAHGDGKHHGVSGGVHFVTTVLATLAAVLGVGIAFAGYIGLGGKPSFSPAIVARRAQPFTTVLEKKYYFDEAYGWLVLFVTRFLIHLMAAADRYVVDMIVNAVGIVGRIAGRLTGVFDNTVVDGAVNGSAFLAAFSGEKLSYAQDGKLRHYLAYIVVGAVGLSAILMLTVK